MENVLKGERTSTSIDEEVVGFEDDAENIIQQLTGGTKELDIVSIVGMPGLGKTTLATKVYTSHFIDKHFDVRAWCSISKEYNLRKVFLDILKQVVGNNMDDSPDEDLRDKLRKSLMHKRYLIVLDDIWEVEAWEELQLSFPDNENGSRAVLTTRDEEVAGFEEVVGFEENVLKGERTSTSIDEEVVGFEDDAENIIQQLTGGTKELDIVSIVGMPGLGKTTLATKVYTSHFIDKHFDVRAWCSISKEYNLRKVFLDILKQVVGNNMDDSPDEDLRDKLRKSLMHKRYLIVLDDIWEVEAWEELQLSFPDNENGSRAVLTTRDEEVARQLKHHSDPYFLRFLTVDESWDLLQKKVFDGEICPPELLETGLQIAENCKGLPLAIVLIAGIIAKQRQASLWLGFAKDLSSHVLEEQNMKIIESSFDHLEDHLKSCLLYMGLFPEDHQFPVFNLLKLWIAENFVDNMDTENVEEASKICLNDLVNKSLVIVSRRREDNGEIEYCTVHDLVHEFCLRKLAKEKFMQYKLSKEPQSYRFIHDDLVRQLLQYTKSLDRIPMLADLKEGESFAHPKSRIWEKTFPILDNLRFIRVLHLLDVCLDIRSWTTAVQLVTHLRYLAICTQEFDFQWVSHLHDLQTLQVVGKDDQLWVYFGVSPSIWKMQKLRHVDIQDFSFKWEDSHRALFEESSETHVLPNLKTFGKCRIYLADKTPEFWWRFPNIEQLKLHFIEPGYEVDMPNLEQLPLLSLQLHFSRPISGYKFTGGASCIVFPSNLKDLSLDRLCLTEKVVSQLARLRNLESLKLCDIYFKSENRIIGQSGYSTCCWDVSDYEFQQLKYLLLQNVFMTEWRSSEASFPVLEKLIINKCKIQIPSSFVDIPTLKLIKLICCDKSLEDSALNIKKEVEEIAGCDSLQVHTQYQTYDSHEELDFAADWFSVWDQKNIQRSLT